MSVDVSLVSELFKTNGTESKNASAKVNHTGSANIAGAFFDDETVITSANNLDDAYDRGTRGGDDKPNEKAVDLEMLEKLADVVNADNFSMYEELGLAPDKDEPSSLLTVSERIEIELATYCEDYTLVGNISAKDIEALYGNTGMSYHVANELMKNNLAPDEKNVSEVMEAIDKVKGIKEIDRAASEYLLINNKSITIDNVYMAVHSVSDAGNRTFNRLSDSEWEELSDQAEIMLEQSGMEVNEETLEDARWLIEEKIPLTRENIYKLAQIRDINENQINNSGIDEMAWAEKISSDMAFLGAAGSSSMDYYKTVQGDSIEAVTIINNGTEEQIESLLLDGKDVTLLNLKRYQEKGTKNAMEDRAAAEKEIDTRKQREIISAKRCLEEARLKLTVQSGALLIKHGVIIDISTLSETVEKLREMENTLAEDIFHGIGYKADAGDVELFRNTNDYMRDFVRMPAYVLGSVYAEEIAFNVSDMSVEGAVKENVLRSAQAAYDTLGTKPDREYGDSIKKAFAGISDMLLDMGLEDNEANNRAVRILSYNEMEISKENIQNIKELDVQVSRLIDNLTPRTTAYLIANGINPLGTDITELNDRLDEINEEIGADEVERYSEYLWKLEKNNEISKEDREVYVGIYRIIHMIDNTDRRAVGAVIKQGRELTMRNLLTAVRNVKRSGMDIAVDDDLGLTESLVLAENNIDNQIKSMETSVFSKRAKDVLSPELIKQALEEGNTERKNVKNVMDMNPEEFAEYMSDKSYEAVFDRQIQDNTVRSREVENLKYISEETLNAIMEDGMNTNVDNLIGLNYIMNSRGKLFSRIQNVCDDEKTDRDIEELIEELADAVGNTEESTESVEKEESLKEKIDKLTVDVKEAMLAKAEIRAEDLRQINGAVNYMKKAAGRESYYVPMQLGREQVLVRFTLNRGDGEPGKAKIRIYGKDSVLIDTELRIKEDEIKISRGAGLTQQELEDIEKNLNKNVDKTGQNILFKVSKQFISEINIYRKQADI